MDGIDGSSRRARNQLQVGFTWVDIAKNSPEACTTGRARYTRAAHMKAVRDETRSAGVMSDITGGGDKSWPYSELAFPHRNVGVNDEQDPGENTVTMYMPIAGDRSDKGNTEWYAGRGP